MPRKYRKTHYVVFILPDGTVIYSRPARKPKGSRADPDGVTIERPTKIENLQGQEGWYIGMVHSILSTRLNVRRALREMIEPRLARIEARIEDLLSALKAQSRPG